MIKRYLAKILAKDRQGLQVISACWAGAKTKITDIKYLSRNKIFLLSLERLTKESNNDSLKINSICLTRLDQKSKNLLHSTKILTHQKISWSSLRLPVMTKIIDLRI